MKPYVYGNGDGERWVICHDKDWPNRELRGYEYDWGLLKVIKIRDLMNSAYERAEKETEERLISEGWRPPKRKKTFLQR